MAIVTIADMSRSRRCEVRAIYVTGYDKWVSIGQYVKVIRQVKAASPETVYKHGLTSWWPTTGGEIMQQFLASVHDRINDAIPYVKRGAK